MNENEVVTDVSTVEVKVLSCKELVILRAPFREM